MRSHRTLLLGCAAFGVMFGSGPAAAAEPQDHVHTSIEPEIVVTAPFERRRSDVLSGVSVLSDAELTRALRPTIGETLQRQPGVSSTAFGPNASRPVLRGFQGERIRVLTDGIGSFDVSNTSVDHAVTINPLLAERVEVLHGPASLLYGSSAIGGVVNVLDKRIPRRVPDEPVHADLIAGYGSAANELSGGAAIDVPLGGPFVAHLDASYLDSDDLEIGGHVLSPALRREASTAGLDELAALKGKLPNTDSRTWDVAGSLAAVTEGGSFGVAVSHLDSLYGVPERFSLDPDVPGEGPVHIDMRQTRVDARAEVNMGGFFDKLRARFGWADYEHSEIDSEGEVGTTFFNKGLEGRIELAQAKRGGWQGAVGGQLLIRNFDSVGEERFVPKNRTVQAGLFALQEVDVAPFHIEAAARYEHSDVRSSEIGVHRRFDALSGSLGASYPLAEGWRIGVNGSRTVRAPSAEELFANGPHAGTQAFEIGNPNFKLEKGWGLEGVLRGKGEGYTLEASVFANWFSNYIYETQTGEIEDELPVFQYAQGKARYYGIEAQGSLTLGEAGGWIFVADALGDYVRARVSGVGPVPRIPPLRLLGGIEAQSERVDARIEVEWVDDQKRTAAFETPTEGYTMVNASAAFRPWGEESGASLLLSLNNIFDVAARRHTSFLKDFAPLAGRDLRLTLRASF